MKQKFDRFNYIKMKLNYERQKYTNKSDKVQKMKLPQTLQKKANNPKLPKIFINQKEKNSVENSVVNTKRQVTK